MARSKCPKPLSPVERRKLLGMIGRILQIDPLRMPVKLRREYVAKQRALRRKDWAECARLGVISWD